MIVEESRRARFRELEDGTPATLLATVDQIFHSSPKFTAGLLRLDTGKTAKFSAKMYLRPAGAASFEGHWETHPRFGRQFIVTGITANAAPLSTDGLARYLSFLEVRGLGPARARLIAEQFGENFADAIQRPAASLAQETGLPPTLFTELQDRWKQNEKKNATSVWLASSGLTANQTEKLIEAFGDSIIDILREEPYSLIRVLKGFGFKRIDEIAQKTGTAQESPARVEAAIAHAVTSALTEEGHSFLTIDELEKRLRALLDLEDSLPDLEARLEAVAEDDQVTLVPHRGQTLVAHPETYAREQDLIAIFSRPTGPNPHFESVNIDELLEVEVANEVAERPALTAGAPGALGGGVSPPSDEEDPDFDDVDEDENQGLTPPLDLGGPADGLVAAQPEPESIIPRLNPDQRNAVRAALAHNVSLISGGAGSGKTFTIQAIVELAEERGLVVDLAAPTGRAAKRIEEVVGRPAQTLHRLLGSNGRTFLHEDAGRLEGLKNADDTWAWDAAVVHSDIVIIDEVSMVDIDLCWHFFQSVDLDRTAVVFVGDHNQLPPVGPGSILRDLVARRPIPTTILENVVRQSGALKENSTALLKGQVRPGIPAKPLEEPDRGLTAPPDPAGPADSADAPHPIEVAQRPGPSAGAPGPGGGVSPRSRSRSPSPSRLFTPWAVKDQFDNPEDARRFILKLYSEILTEQLGYDLVRDVQLLSPMKKGVLGTLELNRRLQAVIQRKLHGVHVKGVMDEEPPLLVHDRVIQTSNNYELDVMNGTIGRVVAVTPNLEHPKLSTLSVLFDDSDIPVVYEKKLWSQLQLAYALTVHKAQGAEFPCVISVVHQSHAHMHHRNLFYTSVTRARKTSIIVGSKRAIERCARSTEAGRRSTFLGILPMRRATGYAGGGEDGVGSGGGERGAEGGERGDGGGVVETVKMKAPSFMFDDED